MVDIMPTGLVSEQGVATSDGYPELYQLGHQGQCLWAEWPISHHYVNCVVGIFHQVREGLGQV